MSVSVSWVAAVAGSVTTVEFSSVTVSSGSSMIGSIFATCCSSLVFWGSVSSEEVCSADTTSSNTSVLAIWTDCVLVAVSVSGSAVPTLWFVSVATSKCPTRSVCASATESTSTETFNSLAFSVSRSSSVLTSSDWVSVKVSFVAVSKTVSPRVSSSVSLFGSDIWSCSIGVSASSAMEGSACAMTVSSDVTLSELWEAAMMISSSA